MSITTIYTLPALVGQSSRTRGEGQLFLMSTTIIYCASSRKPIKKEKDVITENLDLLAKAQFQNDYMYCIFLHHSGPGSFRSWIILVLHHSGPGSFRSWIIPVLHPIFPACMPLVLHPSCHPAFLSCIPPVLTPSCSAYFPSCLISVLPFFCLPSLLFSLSLVMHPS